MAKHAVPPPGSPAPSSAAVPSAAPAKPLIARLHIWQIQAVRDVLVVAAIIALIWAGYAMRSVTVPLLVALVLAYLFEPVVAKLTKNPKTSRPVVVGGLLLAIGLSFILLLTLTLPLAINQSVLFAKDLRSGQMHDNVLKLRDALPAEYRPEFLEKAIEWINPAAKHVPSTQPDAQSTQPVDAEAAPVDSIGPDEDRIRQIVREEVSTQSQAAQASQSTSWLDIAGGGGRAIFSLLGSVVELGLLTFLIPFYFYFFSVSYPIVVRFGRELLPLNNRPRILELIGKMDRAVAGFVRGRIVICGLMGIMLAIGWMFCGVPYFFVLGLVVGVFSLVPYLGTVGLPLAVGFLAIEQFRNHQPGEVPMTWWAIILWPTVVFIIVQAIEAYVLTPMIAGKATNLDPVTILVAVLAGGSVGGVYGMILAIPVAACLKILCTDVLLPHVRAWTKGETQDPLPIAHE